MRERTDIFLTRDEFLKAVKSCKTLNKYFDKCSEYQTLFKNRNIVTKAKYSFNFDTRTISVTFTRPHDDEEFYYWFLFRTENIKVSALKKLDKIGEKGLL